jgi:hypothetical protein
MLIDPIQIHAVSGEYRWPARMVLGRDHQEWRPGLGRGKLMPSTRWHTNGIRLATTLPNEGHSS